MVEMAELMVKNGGYLGNKPSKSLSSSKSISKDLPQAYIAADLPSVKLLALSLKMNSWLKRTP